MFGFALCCTASLVQDGNTPLLCAAQANQFLTANNLVNNSSNVNAQNRQLKCGVAARLIV